MKQQTLKGLFTTALTVVAVLAMGGAALAFSSGPPVEVPNIPPVDSGSQPASGAASARNCHTRYTNGTGVNHLNWCFSDDGNISHLEHGDEVEHVEVGETVEGWCISADSTKRGQTNGQPANFGLSAPSYPSPDKVRHNTTDGSLRVESRFSTSPGNKQIVVKMNVRNNTDSPIGNVFLTRFIDADMNSSAPLDEWTSTVRSVTAHEPGAAMLQLFPKTDEFAVNSMIFDQHLPDLNEFCYNPAADATLSAPADDGSMGILYQLGTIDPGETKTVQFIYRISR